MKHSIFRERTFKTYFNFFNQADPFHYSSHIIVLVVWAIYELSAGQLGRVTIIILNIFRQLDLHIHIHVSYKQIR